MMATSLKSTAFVGTAIRSAPAVRPKAARSPVAVFAADGTWYPGADRPSWLDGSMPGDRGFDPLGLAAKPELRKYFQNGEVINARWAMLAVAGILAADALHRGDWWTAGAQEYAVDTKTQLLVGIPTFAVLEALRAKGYAETGDYKFQDPAGMDSAESRLKEIKNGRLAMIAFIGFSSQAAVQGLGPIECLQKHLEDPAHNNIFTSAVGAEATVGAIALGVLPMLIEAKQVLAGNDDEEFKPIPW